MNINFVREKVACGQVRVLHVPSVEASFMMMNQVDSRCFDDNKR